MTLEEVPLRLGSVLEDIKSLLGQKAAAKRLALAVDLPEELARQSLLGDPLRLEQVLVNLVGNAIKFTDEGGIVVRFVKLAETPEALRLRCEVTDTGIGVAPEALPRLFDAFEQADTSFTRKYGGTGLGLSISKRLVEMMGGEIGVESTPGAGSTFWFTLRLKRREAAVPPAPTLPLDEAEARLRREHAGRRILLAEDEPINREVATIQLEEAGLAVEIAEDGEAALRLAREKIYDLILMDMQMPKLSGLEAARAIRAESKNRATPIIALTANAFDEDRQRCLDAGMNDHIAKPVSPATLYATLLRWLR